MTNGNDDKGYGNRDIVYDNDNRKIEQTNMADDNNNKEIMTAAYII